MAEKKKPKGRRISSWQDMTPAEMAHAANGGRWNFRHCNGTFCSSEQVVNGTCGGTCQKPKRERQRHEWDAHEEAAYTSAESATRGNMQRRGAKTSVRGIYWPTGRRPWRSASKELTQYWDGGGMVPVTFTEYASGKSRPQGRPWTDPDDQPKRKPRAAAAARKPAAGKGKGKGKGTGRRGGV